MLLLSKHRRKHVQTTGFFFTYTSQQSTLPRNIRAGKISLEIDMKAISKPYKKIFQCLGEMIARLVKRYRQPSAMDTKSIYCLLIN